MSEVSPTLSYTQRSLKIRGLLERKFDMCIEPMLNNLSEREDYLLEFESSVAGVTSLNYHNNDINLAEFSILLIWDELNKWKLTFPYPKFSPHTRLVAEM